MPPVLLSTAPDLTSDYWTVKQLPAFCTVINGVRVNQDLLARVRRARMAVEQCLGQSIDPNPERAGGGGE